MGYTLQYWIKGHGLSLILTQIREIYLYIYQINVIILSILINYIYLKNV